MPEHHCCPLLPLLLPQLFTLLHKLPLLLPQLLTLLHMLPPTALAVTNYAMGNYPMVTTVSTVVLVRL